MTKEKFHGVIYVIELCLDKYFMICCDACFTENSGLHVFDFLANSILKEVLSAIQKGKPGAFSPGRPTGFLKNYKSSLDFLAHLEGSDELTINHIFYYVITFYD